MKHFGSGIHQEGNGLRRWAFCKKTLTLPTFLNKYFMYQPFNKNRHVLTFKHFARKGYALFSCLHKEVRIGCLAVAMLGSIPAVAVSTRTDSISSAPADEAEDRVLDDAEVTGSRVPLTLAETANLVSVITRQDIARAKVQTVNDLLKLCLDVDVRQRGGFGVQTDISIGGGTFDQISILLNGVSLNNPQSGHLSADFPVAIQDIERIEVYDGASARTFGSQALNGAINIITKIDNKNEEGLHAEAGSYGTAGGGAYLNYASRHYLNRISADHMRSDGGTDNSGFDKRRLFYQGNYIDHDVKLVWQAGWNKQRYGANTFYSARYPNQWESGDRYMASFKAITNGRIHLAPMVSWIRSYDHFQLIRNSHTAENFHRNDVFTAAVNAYTTWALGRTAFGGELRHEGILSSNLGKPLTEDQYVKVRGEDSIFYNHRDNRTNISFFLEHNIVLRQFSLSAGVMANRNSSVNDKFYLYPGIDVSYRPAKAWKIFASWNKSMRLPTFTDLYYHSPTQEGNVGLRPEKASTFKVGGEYRTGILYASLSGIYRHGTNMIDWVMFTSDDVYHATNFKIDNYELQARARLDFTKLWGEESFLQGFSAGYIYNYQKRHDGTEIFKSNYALEYLRHKLLLQLDHRIWNSLSASWYLRWQKRLGSWLGYDAEGHAVLTNYHPYALLNLKLRWTRPRYDLYASFENLTCHRYYDLGAIPQPRLWMMFGGSWKFNI